MEVELWDVPHSSLPRSSLNARDRPTQWTTATTQSMSLNPGPVLVFQTPGQVTNEKENPRIPSLLTNPRTRNAAGRPRPFSKAHLVAGELTNLPSSGPVRASLVQLHILTHHSTQLIPRRDGSSKHESVNMRRKTQNYMISIPFDLGYPTRKSRHKTRRRFQMWT